MKLFHNSFRRMFHQECSKFRHLLELRGFLPSVLSIDLQQCCDNWRKIAQS